MAQGAGESDAELNDRLARAARATANGMVLLSAEGRITWVNDSFVRLFGFSLDEVRGRTPRGLMTHPDTDPRLLTEISRRLGAAEPFNGELQFIAKGGRPFWIELDLRPITDDAGRPDGFSMVMTEVTSSKAIEEKLKSTAVSLRSAGRLARLGGWEIDLRARCVRWSPELLEILGRPASQEDMLGSLDTYVEEDRDHVQTVLADAARSGERFDFEARALGADRQVIWLRVIGEPEMVDGRCVAIHGASQDITAQRAAQAELMESERFARGVIDGVGAMLTVIDAEGRVIAANRAFRDLGTALNGGTEYQMGRNLFSVLETLPAPHGKALVNGVQDVLEGRRNSFIHAYPSSGGEWHRATATRFAGEGPVRCVVFTQSIEDLKQSERRLKEANARMRRARDDADAASAAKSAFLATMSHEIRTPLNGVLGMAQAMARDSLTSVQRERLTVIQQAGQTLLDLLNDLLDLSRIEAGRLELEDGQIDLEQMLQGVKATFHTLAMEKDLSVSFHLADEARGLWRGDPTRVRQILYNLVSNAVKFTARGSVTVDVGTESGDLVLEVADTGPGIAQDRLVKLFEKFVQADASTTRRFGGSGLGLSICRELAELMGGSIMAQSVVGLGSTFTVRLPLARTHGAAQVRDDRLSAPEARDASGLRILAAEDNPMNRLVLKTLLAQIGLDIECVEDGAQAVDAWERGAWDVILMDVQMPGMDGPTAAREIRSQEAATGRPRTPIIALTANAMAHHRDEYLAAGMDALVPKPLELERLLIAIQQLMDEGDTEFLDQAAG